ncbi:MAG TPA: hypothetical protein VJ718_08850 [Candidatus Binataceae bacterium]|nr:hypothetical protein [Candidatus Binataceae bacterium]
MQGIMVVYAVFAALIIVVVLLIVLAWAISAAIDAYRRAFGKKKDDGGADSRPLPGGSRGA